ncbi:hypothetical protein BGZ61DRAFT_482260 [Ilyonectria robusta]|uniref:uncharacterized protein n=1 Tax=Ilyonectria robusta TaxID=1079257 RepID=UPI001E8DB418|nr:uncharacterized protein BGZ61DRAFT_482260 [Ilyonectria robusta]KAH8672994.1 hypothetical protein BGZ61DRAFT_482260 [Ilyonectria robusta]
MTTYMQQQVESDAVTEYAQKHPEDLDGLFLRMRQQYALEMRMNAIQPKPNQNLDTLCDHYQLRDRVRDLCVKPSVQPLHLQFAMWHYEQVSPGMRTPIVVHEAGRISENASLIF